MRIKQDLHIQKIEYRQKKTMYSQENQTKERIDQIRYFFYGKMNESHRVSVCAVCTQQTRHLSTRSAVAIAMVATLMGAQYQFH